MKSDQDYLQSAGITDTEVTPTPEVTPSAEPAQPQTPTETFELSGNKYPVTSEFQFNHGGKVLKVPYNSLVNTYRQAQHLQDQRSQFNKEREEHQTKYQDFDKLKGFYDKYGQLQDWSEKNPQEWQRLFDIWQNKDQHLLNAQVQPGQQAPGQQGPNLNPLVQEVTQLKQALSKYDTMFEKMQAQEKEAAEMKDVDFVKNEVQTFSKNFPEISLTEQDPDGVPLWAKIVQWGNANGYNEFTPAAHMYLQERVAQTWQARARAEATKSLKQDYTNGIVRKSATPIGQGQPPTNIKKMSYAEIADMAKSGQFAQG